MLLAMPSMPKMLVLALAFPTAAGNVTVCAVLATVTRTVTKLNVPAAEKLVNAKLMLPAVVTVW